MSIREAVSPTAAELLDVNFYPARYAWRNNGQEKTANTVIAGFSEEAALEIFRRQHPHLTKVEIIKD